MSCNREDHKMLHVMVEDLPAVIARDDCLRRYMESQIQTIVREECEVITQVHLLLQARKRIVKKDSLHIRVHVYVGDREVDEHLVAKAVAVSIMIAHGKSEACWSCQYQLVTH